jgi:hypothetical protein
MPTTSDEANLDGQPPPLRIEQRLRRHRRRVQLAKILECDARSPHRTFRRYATVPNALADRVTEAGARAVANRPASGEVAADDKQPVLVLQQHLLWTVPNEPFRSRKAARIFAPEGAGERSQERKRARSSEVLL